MRLICFGVLILVGFMVTGSGAAGRKQAVAHRGASAYAPEHTLASYRLALEQKADFVEQDLAVTKDGVLICLHDPTLERTTNVEEVFPDRATEVTWEGRTHRRSWLANDFTLAEIKRLDAGSWFGSKFAGERIPTFQEAIDLVKGKAGLYPELKVPEIYAGRNVEFEKDGCRNSRPERSLGADRRPEDAGHPPDVQRSYRAQSRGDEAGCPGGLSAGSARYRALGPARECRSGESCGGERPGSVEKHPAEVPAGREVGPRIGTHRDAVYLPIQRYRLLSVRCARK